MKIRHIFKIPILVTFGILAIPIGFVVGGFMLFVLSYMMSFGMVLPILAHSGYPNNLYLIIPAWIFGPGPWLYAVGCGICGIEPFEKTMLVFDHLSWKCSQLVGRIETWFHSIFEE